ncbi:MAG TPA: circularly permuted type 2 ATP-grasp protein [Brevundimonas sp.]|uniref:circularly permuted type 2 ATP-grasp protein n=1 Tax=Brevundimonas sp. TaxID=1871086 RepID=UPI0032C214B4|nr:circularly permuted type 2 ATP-grasp protein [Brevundimonas sp.]
MSGLDGSGVRPAYEALAAWIAAAPPDLLKARAKQAEVVFRRMGVTFAVYGDAESNERLIPFDVVPRILAAREWMELERGLKQRVAALNAFLKDIYGPQDCLRAGVAPADLILTNPQYRPEMQGRRPPGDVWCHICGVDLIRTGEHGFYVLEDNARTPSGVSYMLENREMMMRLFPDLFAEHGVRPVDTYVDDLLRALEASAPAGAGSDPTIVVLTPGPFNSAYYEHSFLADKLGVELVEGADLFVNDDQVFMRTTQGPRRVDVIYRRIDDDFLDPLTFRPDSAVGVPGLMTAYQAGTVTLANAVGTGVADDKAVYTYMPEIVEFFTGEAPILKNVPTWRCREPEALKEVLDRLPELVVKEVGGSGGYGMLVGPAATKAEIETFRQKLIADPDDFIAQPTLQLSTAPTLSGDGLSPRHVDLRPFVLTSPSGVRVTPGGLTRVALKPGSLVVNSSQGGGTKDTWVLDV